MFIYDEALVIQDQLKKAFKDMPKMEVKFEALQAAVLQKNHGSFEFDASVYWLNPPSDPSSYLEERYHCTNGSRNYEAYCDPKLDKLIEASQSELNPEKRKQILVEAQKYLLDTVALAGINGHTNRDLLQPYVKGYVSGPTWTAYNQGLKYVWLNK